MSLAFEVRKLKSAMVMALPERPHQLLRGIPTQGLSQEGAASKKVVLRINTQISSPKSPNKMSR